MLKNILTIIACAIVAFIVLAGANAFTHRNDLPALPTDHGQIVPPLIPPTVNDCVIGGCSGQLCYDPKVESGISDCMARPEYACYKTATCVRQPTGKCGWTETSELAQCLASH